MSAVEWNKKEDLLQEQALRHLKQYTTLFAAFATNYKSELVLLNKVQEYCYDNMNFIKTFNKIVLLFYKSKFFYIIGKTKHKCRKKKNTFTWKYCFDVKSVHEITSDENSTSWVFQWDFVYRPENYLFGHCMCSRKNEVKLKLAISGPSGHNCEAPLRVELI